jgi:predicted PurR-regulated permease PerM
MMIIAAILAILFKGLIGGTALYFGAKITKEDVEFRQAFLIALAGALCALIPFFGGFLIGWIVMLILLNKWCDCAPFPGGVLLIVVSGILQIVIGLVIAGLFASCTHTGMA